MKRCNSYFTLWDRTAIPSRRIESFQVIDRVIIERRRIYDLDLSVLRGVLYSRPYSNHPAPQQPKNPPGRTPGGRHPHSLGRCFV